MNVISRLNNAVTWRMKQAYRRRWPSDPRWSFDELFPETPKSNYRSAEDLPFCEEDDFPGVEIYLREERAYLPEDYTAVLDNVLYCPRKRVVLDGKRRALRESGPDILRLDSLYRDPVYLHRPPTFVDGYCALLQYAWPAYYHTIFDAAPRLLSLWAKPYVDLLEIKLLCSGEPSELEKHLVKKLAPPNCRIITVSTDRLIEAERLIFTPSKASSGYLRPEDVSVFREKLLPKRPSKRNRRILISRENAEHRHIENFLELRKVLEVYDFETVVSDNLSFQDEIDLFYDARVVVGAHGSGLANIVFSDSVSVIDIFPTEFVIPHIYRISKMLGHDYRSVIGTGREIFPERFTVNVDKVRSIVDKTLALEEYY